MRMAILMKKHENSSEKALFLQGRARVVLKFSFHFNFEKNEKTDL